MKLDIGFIFIILLILKLTHTVDWSWWWIFSPIWAPVALIIAIFLIAVIAQVVIGTK